MSKSVTTFEFGFLGVPFNPIRWVKKLDKTMVEVKKWDGSTVMKNYPHHGEPSSSASEFIPVVGQGTQFPIGFTLVELHNVWKRVRGLKIDYDIGMNYSYSPEGTQPSSPPPGKRPSFYRVTRTGAGTLNPQGGEGAGVLVNDSLMDENDETYWESWMEYPFNWCDWYDPTEEKGTEEGLDFDTRTWSGFFETIRGDPGQWWAPNFSLQLTKTSRVAFVSTPEEGEPFWKIDENISDVKDVGINIDMGGVCYYVDSLYYPKLTIVADHLFSSAQTFTENLYTDRFADYLATATVFGKDCYLYWDTNLTIPAGKQPEDYGYAVLTISANEYWPHKNSLGQPVFDQNYGLQLNSIG